MKKNVFWIIPCALLIVVVVICFFKANRTNEDTEPVIAERLHARDNMPIGSCGPTTSSRMDIYTPQLIELGLAACIGKGMRSLTVVESTKKHHSLYLCAIGGAGALAAKCVKKLDVIAFDDLGCESVKRLEIVDFPLIVGIDIHGGNIFDR